MKNKKLQDLEIRIAARKKENEVNWKSDTVRDKVSRFRVYTEINYGVASIANLSNFMILAIIQIVDSESRDNRGISDEEIVFSEYSRGNVSIRQGYDDYAIFLRFVDELAGIENMIMAIPFENSIIWMTDEEMTEAKELLGYAFFD